MADAVRRYFFSGFRTAHIAKILCMVKTAFDPWMFFVAGHDNDLQSCIVPNVIKKTKDTHNMLLKQLHKSNRNWYTLSI